MSVSTLVTLDNLNTVYEDVRNRIDAAIGGVYQVKGSKTWEDIINLSSAKQGDVYNISENYTGNVELDGKKPEKSQNVVCRKTFNTRLNKEDIDEHWDYLGGVFSIADENNLGLVRVDGENTDNSEVNPTSTTIQRKIDADKDGTLTVTIPLASEGSYGLVSTTNQTFCGDKIFTGSVTISNASIEVGGNLHVINSLNATTIDVTGNITGANINVGTITTTVINSDNASISNLYSTNSTITNIEASELSAIDSDEGLQLKSTSVFSTKVIVHDTLTSETINANSVNIINNPSTTEKEGVLTAYSVNTTIANASEINVEEIESVSIIGTTIIVHDTLSSTNISSTITDVHSLSSTSLESIDIRTDFLRSPEVYGRESVTSDRVKSTTISVGGEIEIWSSSEKENGEFTTPGKLIIGTESEELPKIKIAGGHLIVNDDTDSIIGSYDSLLQEGDTQEVSPNVDASISTTGGIYAGKCIYAGQAVFNAVWNDLVDCILVPEDTELEYGYCYCFDGEKYYKSSKYMDNGFIGIHSDTYGIKMGIKPNKTLDAAVAGFVLAYVDKEYPVGTPLTCTENGYLTEMKEEDISMNGYKICATYWKYEKEESWGNGERSISVNGRHWVKVR